MKKKFIAFLSLLLIFSLSCAGCGSFSGEDSDITQYNDEMEAATGKWLLLDEDDTYFIFDGAKNEMSFRYYEDNTLKYSGKFRAIYKEAEEALSPLSFIVTRDDKAREDWINCYVENFDEGLTQFSIMDEEENLGVTDGTVYTHIYRISEMPYKIGTYVLEHNEYKAFSKTGFDDGTYRIPEGTYVSETGQSLKVLPLMNRSYLLFQYINGDVLVEGILNIAMDKKTVYLYIEHDIYEKIRRADKENYDTTFSNYYPPDFYLRGDFDTNANSLVINGLYHHDYSPTEIDDAIWVFGTYVKQ